MNICYNNHNSRITKQYKQIFDFNSYEQIITTPTPVSKQTANFLDNIICNRDDRVTYSGVMKTGISDHFLAYCTRKHKKFSIRRHKTKIRPLKKIHMRISYIIPTGTCSLQNRC